MKYTEHLVDIIINNLRNFLARDLTMKLNETSRFLVVGCFSHCSYSEFESLQMTKSLRLNVES